MKYKGSAPQALKYCYSMRKRKKNFKFHGRLIWMITQCLSYFKLKDVTVLK